MLPQRTIITVAELLLHNLRDHEKGKRHSRGGKTRSVVIQHTGKENAIAVPNHQSTTSPSYTCFTDPPVHQSNSSPCHTQFTDPPIHQSTMAQSRSTEWLKVFSMNGSKSLNLMARSVFNEWLKVFRLNGSTCFEFIAQSLWT